MCSFAHLGRYFYNIIFQIFIKFLFIIFKKHQNTLSSAPCTSSDFYYFNFIFLGFLFYIFKFNKLMDVIGNCHTIVRFKYFTWGKPCILRIIFFKLFLIFLISQKIFKVYRLFHLPNLDVIFAEISFNLII